MMYGMTTDHDSDKLILNGVTHRLELVPVEDDRWDYMLTAWSPAGEGQVLLTPDECHRLREYLSSGRDPGFGSYVDPRCRCTGEAHEKYGDDCCLIDDRMVGKAMEEFAFLREDNASNDDDGEFEWSDFCGRAACSVARQHSHPDASMQCTCGPTDGCTSCQGVSR